MGEPQIIKLYPDEGQLAAVERVTPLERDAECQRCSLYARARTICMAPDVVEDEAGSTDTVLVVAEKPVRDEDQRGKPQVGITGKYLREQVRRWWHGRVVYENAVRCCPGDRDPAEGQISACRSFVAGSIRRYQPSRVICLGGPAVESVLGRSVAPFSVRRGHGWLARTSTPVFMVIHPAAASRNRFVRQWFEADLKWALTGAPPMPPPWRAEALLVRSQQDANVALERFYEQGGFAFDTETYGALYDSDFRLLCVALAPGGQDVAYVWDRVALDDEALVAPLRRVMEDRKLLVSAHNWKYDAHAMALGAGARVRRVYSDTRLWRKLLDPDADGYLDTMMELVGMGGAKDESEALLKERKPRPSRVAEGQAALTEEEPRKTGLRYAFAELPHDVLVRRCALDAIATGRLVTLLDPQVQQDGKVLRVWRDLVQPANDALRQVEAWGVAVSREAIEATDQYLTARQAEVSARLASYGDFDVDSPKQVGELLYGKLHLVPPRKTEKGNPSTDKEALEALADRHPIVNDILVYRTFNTLKKTYAKGSKGDKGLYAHIRGDGRIHPTFNLDGARSGRLSCENPNLQNIPRPDEDREESVMIRNVFIAPPGTVLLEADYSQLELRIAAWMSGDEAMKQVFIAGEDIHQRTAEGISMLAWGIEPAAVRSSHRSKAKVVNFGLIYGKTDRTLAKELGISVEEAHAIREAILGRFPRFRAWMDECLAYARKKGEVWTWWDGKPARRRPLWRIADADDLARSRAEHGSWNSPIQGTASDFCLRSLVECVRWLHSDAVPAKLVLTVHDSLMFEVQVEAVHEVAWQVRRIMQSWNSGGVPLVVDIKTGPSWGRLEKYVEGT